MREKLPKVLVVATNAWRDNTGINTLIKIFKCWDKDQIAQIYTKSLLPKTNICNKFFSISEAAMIKSLVKKRVATGKEVYNETNLVNTSKNNINAEEKLYFLKKGKHRNLMFFLRELVWKFGKWKSEELDRFISQIDADVLFIPIYPTIYMGRIQKYIIDKTEKPVVSFLADDNYTYQSIRKGPFSFLHRYYLRKYVEYIVKKSHSLMVIAPKQKDEYDRIFDVDSIVLTKGIEYTEYKPYKVSRPIKMVYTGKLIIGRWKSLAAIAETLKEINSKEKKIELDIYTTDALTKKQQVLLNRNGCQVKGSLTLEEVENVQKGADILVFVESLEKSHRQTARLSFSTKITDYLEKGKCIFAIGDQEIAPIDYFKRNDSAIIASSSVEIKEKLYKMVDNPLIIEEYAQKAYNCGVENHNSDKIDSLLKNIIMSATDSK